MPQDLRGCVCLVTGATRGIGRGIALGLSECGCTIYITGRTLETKSDSAIGGSLKETAEEIVKRGGTAIPVVVDHSDDAQVEALFDQIRREQNGRLDVLVNNAYAGVGYLLQHGNVPFYKIDDTPGRTWDIINNVGLRNHYICSTLACRLMEANKRRSIDRPGIIINVSSLGAEMYLFNVAYGVGKAALDRMTRDMHHEVAAKREHISIMILRPGPVKTEELLNFDKETGLPPTFADSQTPELSGRVVAAIVADAPDKIMARSGRVVDVGDEAIRRGITEVDGSRPLSPRSVKFLLALKGHRVAQKVPEGIRVPNWLFNKLVARR